LYIFKKIIHPKDIDVVCICGSENTCTISMKKTLNTRKVLAFIQNKTEKIPL
jgi:hypothetical protein